MTMFHDPELPAGYQDADIEMAELEAAGARIAQWRRSGGCAHQGAVSYRNPPVYPEQEGLEPGQLRCTDGCGMVFADDEAWSDAVAEILS